tara:strand:- start:260 stop:418 length:159 start_codon:yes stop_codon:yes gene_type:complete
MIIELIINAIKLPETFVPAFAFISFFILWVVIPTKSDKEDFGSKIRGKLFKK